MRARLLSLVISLCIAFLAGADALEDAKKELRDAMLKDSSDGQKAAVQKIVALNDPRGLLELNNVLMEVIPSLRKSDAELAGLENDLEQRKEKIERLKANPDEQKKAEAKKAEIDLKEFVDKKVAPVRKRAGNLKSSREIVSGGIVDLIANLPAEKRRVESDRLAKTIQDTNKGWEDRASAMECYARMGEIAAFGILWKVDKESQTNKKKSIAELPEKEAAFEKERARFYDQVQKQGGKYYKGAEENMQKLEKEVKGIQERIYASAQLVEAANRLIPVNIASLGAAQQQKPISELTGAAKGNDPGARLAAIEILGGVPDANVRAFLRTLIVGGDPGVRIAALDSLIKQKDEGAIDIILEKCIKDDEWTVRAAAIQALIVIRTAKSVPALIAALENEVGRLRDDAQDALESLTSQTLTTPPAWKQWWEKSQNGFTVAPPASQPSKRGPRVGDTGVAFAGIQTSSKNIAYVVDVSGSMNFGLESEGPPVQGKPTRFEMLKKELVASIEHLPEGGKFIMITFSSGVTQITPQPQPVNKDTKAAVLKFIEKDMKAEGSTNIYAALKSAFDLAGMGATDKFYKPVIDTIFFLTDGTPSPDTEMTDPERLLAYVRERNKLGKLAVHVVCLGEADASFLRKLAEQNHGEFVKP
ncbi:MAG: HEAT repeat domain-containing protein [Planctomycetes bacterium]|nr:HEAT repeat domain-containing protein [Planctomycetota bacterium]